MDDSCTLQNCVNWDSKTLILSLKNWNFSDFADCQGEKTISSIWRFDGGSHSSCRPCTAFILDPATKSNCFLCKQIVVFFFRKGLKNRVPKDFYVPPLLESFVAHSRILMKSLVIFFKKWMISSIIEAWVLDSICISSLGITYCK